MAGLSGQIQAVATGDTAAEPGRPDNGHRPDTLTRVPHQSH
jgi:hypothetical protein